MPGEALVRLHARRVNHPATAHTQETPRMLMSWKVKCPTEEVEERLRSSCSCSGGRTERRNLIREESLESLESVPPARPRPTVVEHIKDAVSATRTNYGDNGQLAPALQDTRL